MTTGGFADFECVDAILRHALKLAPEERAAFVERECGSDTRLLARIRKLLSAAEAAGRFTPGGAWRGTQWPGGNGDKKYSAAGESFGAWRALEEIGRGGMAVVYRGERARGDFEQQVAIKLLHASQAEPFEQRFRRERQILARLEHPNIGRLLDGGATASGRSYLVMEYIEGDAIDRYCERRNLSLQARLELFLKVCAAVQFAHRNLIVHRDLKPSNILINTEGEPKLLDFGIAKLLEPDPDTGDLTRTALAERMLTPQYASPEQVLGEPVSTATDVYALGLLLYELLTGERARRFDTSSPREIEHIICDTEPPRPSVAVSIPRVSRRLKGDLDNIVLKALRREPERRYSSIEQLAADIGSHLSGRPVQARPDSVMYRMRKFVSRHAVGVVTSVGVMLLMIALIGFYTNRLAGERDAAEVAAEAARLEAATATRVSDFLTEIFKAADPARRTEDDEPSVTELLQQATRSIDDQLGDEPLLQARLLMALGQSFSNLGRYDEAQTLLERSLDLHRRKLGGSHPDTASSLRTLALTIYRRGDYSTAQSLYLEALQIQEEVLGPDHVEIADTLNVLSNVQKRTGQLPEARAGFERALAIAQAYRGPEHRSVGHILNNLGLLLGEQEDYESARDALQRAISIYESELGPNHLLLTETLGNLAHIQGQLGEHEGRIENCHRYLAIAERQLGEVHLEIANAVVCLGNAYQSADRQEEAIPLYHRAHEIYESAVGPDHQHTAYPLANLGNTYRDTGDYEQALVYYRRALEIWEQHQSTHLAVGMLENIGRVKLLIGESALAVPELRRALSMRQQLHPADHWRIAATQSILGESLAQSERFEDAEPLLLSGYAGLEANHGRDDQRTREAADRLVMLYEAWGRSEQAAAYRSAADQ